MNIKCVLKKDEVLAYCLIVLIICFILLPFVLFGKNCIITIHDNLDSNIPWFKYIRDNNYYFKLNTKSTTLDNLSTLYFAGDFTFKGFMYYIFDDFLAYTLVYAFSIVVGFISMQKLLLLIFRDIGSKCIIMFMSILYAILPVFPGYRIAVATLPFVLYLIFRIFNSFRLRYCLLSLLFPFFSVFESVLIFILGYWFLLIIITSVVYRRVQFRSIICFVLMSIGTIATNCRLFMLRIFYNEPLNRDVFNLSLITDNSLNLKNTIYFFLKYFIKGHEHANSMHGYIILPITFIVFVLILNKLVINRDSENDNVVKYLLKVLLISMVTIIVHCIIICLNEQELVNSVLKLILPPLSGLNFARLYIINNLLWYIIFTCILLGISKSGFAYNRLIVIFLLIAQFILIIFKNNLYQDSWKSWKANLFKDNKYISYNDFFVTSLFDQVKRDIEYKGEITVAVGFHPSVLMYNGFNTADGYISVFPLRDALRFKELIKPELDVNDWANRYYTGWPARRYIYNKDISYEPTKEKYNGGIELRMNMDMFTNYYKGKYILSRAKISNDIDLNLEFVSKYANDGSIYEFFVYKAKQ